MGAFDGLCPTGPKLRTGQWKEFWTVEYDTGKMVKRICDLPPVMERKLEVHYSLEEAQTAAAGKENVEILHYKELSP